MVKPVDHNLASSTTTTAWEGAKGAIMGAVVPVLIGAAVIGGAAYLAGAVITGGGIGWFAELSVAGKLGVVGAAAGAWVGGAFAAVGAAVGAVFGIGKGAKRVHNEQEKFNQRGEVRGQIVEQQMERAQMMGAQMGYAKGVQDAQAAMAERIQQMQHAAIAQQMAEAKEKNCAPCNKHVDAVMKQREAAAAAGAQRA